MKSIARKPFTDKQSCIIEHIIARGGVVVPQEYGLIADACNTTQSYVSSIVNSTDDTGKRVNTEINRRLQYLPIIDRERRVAYAQRLLNDQLQRRTDSGDALTDYDPMEILDYIRKETTQKTTNVDQRTQTVNVFDFSGYDDEKLRLTISKIQDAIDNGGDISGLIGEGFIDAETVRELPVADSSADAE